MTTTEMMKLSLENFLKRHEDDGKSPNTIRAYRADITSFHDWLDGEEIAGGLQRLIADYLNDQRNWYNCAPSTLKRKASVLRSFGVFVTGDPEFMATYRSPTVAPGVAHPLPGVMDDIRTLLDAAETPHHRALVILCGMMGLRVSEARSIWPHSFVTVNGDIDLMVHGKGYKTRRIPVTPKVLGLLAVPITAARANDGPLVPLSDRGARQYITNLGQQVGIGRRISSHDLRHTFATAAYNNSGDIRAVQDLLGHSSVETTQVYTGVSEKARRVAVDV